MTPVTYSVREAADVIGISERQVYRLVEREVLPKVPDLGRLTRIPRVAVERLLGVDLEKAS